MSAGVLNEKFGLGSSLRFTEDTSGLMVAEIENPRASAKITLQGAHLLMWRPRTSSIPVVWLSEDAQSGPGKSPHSGAPVCWPWFGAHESNPDLPSHGYARTAPWEVIESGNEPDGATRIVLRLTENDTFRTQWPHGATLELTVIVGDSLKLALTTTNNGGEDFVIGEAFHTYFQVGDIAQARVTGLEGVTYADKVQNYARGVQQDAITFSGETDRVYLDTEDECVIEDPSLRRRIHIAKSGSRSTVVWTPGQEKGDRLGDLGKEGWRRMLCVESANALENRVTVSAGQSHTLAVEYRAEPL